PKTIAFSYQSDWPWPIRRHFVSMAVPFQSSLCESSHVKRATQGGDQGHGASERLPERDRGMPGLREGCAGLWSTCYADRVSVPRVQGAVQAHPQFVVRFLIPRPPVP